MKYVFLLLLILSRLSFGHDEPLILSYDFVWDGREYTVHIVLPSYLGRPGNNWDANAVLRKLHMQSPVPSRYTKEELLGGVEEFVLQQYRDRGLLDGEDGRAMEETLRTTESIHKGRSAVAFVTSRGSPSDIHAVVRLDAETTEHPHLDVENRLFGRGLKSRLPRPRKRVSWWRGFFTILAPEDQKNDFRFLFYDQKDYATSHEGGGMAEIKNFVKNRESEDFIPLLYTLMESHNASRYTGLKRKEDKGEAVGISTYWLECDGEVRRDYFRRQGWRTYRKVPNPDRPGNFTYVMHMDRQTFKTSLENWIYARVEGWQILLHTPLKLDPFQWALDVCKKVFQQE